MTKTTANKFYKPKNVLSNLEDIQVDEQYCFSFNPQHTIFSGDWKEQYKDMCRWIQEMPSRDAIRLSLRCEFSKSGKLHYHGYITIYDPFIWITEQLPYLLLRGTIDMEIPKDDGYEWDRYIHKQKNHLQFTMALQNIQWKFGNMNDNQKSWLAYHSDTSRNKNKTESFKRYAFDEDGEDYPE